MSPSKKSLSFSSLLLLAISLQAVGTNSIYLRTENDARTRTIRGNQKQQSQTSELASATAAVQRAAVQPQMTVSVSKASWYTIAEPTPTGFHVHDLVTIVVHEVSKHSSKADTKTERESNIDLQIEDWIRFTRGGVRLAPKTNGEPTVKAGVSRDFEGKGDVKREDTLSARIQAEIIDIMPNGNLLLEASHSVTTDDETTTITLTGWCRSQDIGPGNSIVSSQLHGLNVSKTHTGVARDATQKGWVGAILDFINPF